MIAKPSAFGGLFSLHRIVVVGSNGAGKTYVASRLAAALDLPLIHNDALALTTGWVHRPSSEVMAARDEIAMTARWIMEGGPSVLQGGALRRAEAVIWLDLPRGLRLRRILWRSLRYVGQTRPEHPRGNRDWPGFRQARFAIKAYRGDARTRDIIAARLAGRKIPVHRMTTPQQIEELCNACGTG